MASWRSRLAFRKPATPVFILGCQRSGTTICQNVFESSSRFAVFKEGNRDAMTDKWRLRPIPEIRELIDSHRARVLLFKPINDSQCASQFLDAFENSRVIWIHRSFVDTVNSAVSKWGSAQRDMVVWIGRAITEYGGVDTAFPHIMEKPTYAVYAEALPADVAALLSEWTRDTVSDATGAAIMWYIRNRLYFDQSLNDNPRVLLVNYEKFARQPDVELARMCDFMGTRRLKSQAGSVHAGSIGKDNAPPIPAAVLDACEDLQSQLRAAETSTVQEPTT